MSNFSTWLLAIFMVMFWLFRAIVALCTQYSIDLLGIAAYDINMEVIIAFATLPCIVLVVKRKLVCSLFYLAIYAIYFGEHLFTNLVPKYNFIYYSPSLSLYTIFSFQLVY